MRTYTDTYISSSGLRRGEPLPIMQAWANSSQAVTFRHGNALRAAAIRVTDTQTGKYLQPVHGVLHPRRGTWYFYLNKRYFPHGGEGLYKIYGEDLNGGRAVLGEGTLRVFRGRTDDPMDEPGGAETKDNGYIRVGDDWYRVEVAEDDTGAPMFTVRGIAAEGVPDGDEGEAWAYNKATGLYHRVEVAEDDSGALMLTCSDSGVEGDETTFAYDRATNFYHRIECAVDDAGATMLQVGESQA